MTNKNDRDYDLDIKNHYRVEAGQDSVYGAVSYRVLTNNGAGFGIHESGLNKEDMQLAMSGRSVESLGHQIERVRDAAQDSVNAAKFIKCKNGDFLVDCENGDIILKANNIKLVAGNTTTESNDGDVQIKANKTILIDAPDVRIAGSNLRLTARKDFTISAKVTGGIVAGVLNMASSADFAASIPLSKLTQLKDALEAQ